MLIHVSHELLHSWFGIIIGNSDWSEDWLSEGLATFYEDLVHSAAVAMTSSSFDAVTWFNTHKALKLERLMDDLEITPNNLQPLRWLNVPFILYIVRTYTVVYV